MIEKRLAPLCELHSASPGARSSCPYCVIEELYAALSRIDYLCGEPNDHLWSGFDLHMNAQAVVEHVRTRLLNQHYHRPWSDNILTRLRTRASRLIHEAADIMAAVEEVSKTQVDPKLRENGDEQTRKAGC